MEFESSSLIILILTNCYIKKQNKKGLFKNILLEITFEL